MSERHHADASDMRLSKTAEFLIAWVALVPAAAPAAPIHDLQGQIIAAVRKVRPLEQTFDEIGTTSAQAAPSARPMRRSCAAYDRTYPHGSTTWCTVMPGPGRACPLGLHLSLWTCRDGEWLRRDN